MPALAPVMPRHMFPPPTTTAISTPRSERTSAISDAICSTVGPSMPWPAPPAKASPDSLRTTLGQTDSGTDRDQAEPHDRRPAEDLGDRLLLVADVLLLEQHPLLVPAAEATLDDLLQGGLGLALGLGDRRQSLPLGRHLLGRHLVAREV